MAIRLTDVPELLAYLGAEKVATLALPIDTARTLHMATMNYVHVLDPLKFYFMTSSLSQKCTLLNTVPAVSAACTVGTYTHVPFTLQMRGMARTLDKAQQVEVIDMYYAKRGNKNLNIEGEHTVLLQFEATWARYTDYSKGWDTTMLEV